MAAVLETWAFRPLRNLFDLSSRCRMGPDAQLWRIAAVLAADELVGRDDGEHRHWQDAIKALEEYESWNRWGCRLDRETAVVVTVAEVGLAIGRAMPWIGWEER